MRDEKNTVRNFYEDYGWERNVNGVYNDTAAFVDIRPEMRAYQEASMQRLAGHFPGGGNLFLDAGCGALPSGEYVALGDPYTKRVCADFSRKALENAKEKLGAKAMPVLADITALPFREGVFDAILCAHVVYHIPPEEQAGAIVELHRALKPGGTGVVVYTWAHCPMTKLALALNPRVLAPKIPGMRWVWRRFVKEAVEIAPSVSAPAATHPPIFFNPLDHAWYRREVRRRIPVSLVCWQSVSLPFSQAFIFGGRSARAVLAVCSRLERLFPRLMGRLGAYPMFILRKPK